MDSFVMRAPRVSARVFAGLFVGLLGLTAAGAALAQAMGDPTQPPAVVGAPAGVAVADPGEPAPLQLQSILVSREAGGRRVAVINGEVVRPGAKIGDAVVESVGESAVILRRGKNKETLRLFPASARKAAGQ